MDIDACIACLTEKDAKTAYAFAQQIVAALKQMEALEHQEV